MDTSFFSQHLLTIARYRYPQLLFAKERLYYYLYVRKLNCHIISFGSRNVKENLEYVQDFEYKQSQRIKNGWLIKPKKMLALACRDTKDVLQSMKRFEGVGAENQTFFGNGWEVNLRRNS
jgi:hypothetical protein